MNRFRSSARRMLTVAGAAVLGIAAALAIAAPASAHHSEVQGSAVCDPTTGEWVVTWTVTSVAPENVLHYKLRYVNVLPAGTTVTNIEQVTGHHFPYDAHAPLVGEQRVPGDATSATLTVRAVWENGYVDRQRRTGIVQFDGTCQQNTPEPTASFSPNCDGTVQVTLTNGKEATGEAELTVTAKEFTETRVLKPGETADDITVPADAGPITVAEKGRNEPVGEYTWEDPGNCVQPGEPEGAVKSTCDELIITIANPADGKPVEGTFTPSTGERKTLSVAPGETKSVSFPASDGLTVKASVPGYGDDVITWEKPDNCGGAGGGLPVTGASVGGAIGGGLLLLGAGAGLFYFFRRRRVTFTA